MPGIGRRPRPGYPRLLPSEAESQKAIRKRRQISNQPSVKARTRLLHALVNAMSPSAPLDPSDIRRGDWVDRYLPPAFRPYARLARLDRPIGTWLLLFPGWWAIALAALPGGWPNP